MPNQRMLTARNWPLLLAFLAYLVSAIFWISRGYGPDYDSWGVALAARSMADLGHYVMSRPIGFPLHEILLIPLVRLDGPVAANGFSLIAGCLIPWVVFRLHRSGIVRHPLFTSIGVMLMAPVVLNVTTTIDYIPGLVVLLLAIDAFARERYDLAAILLALAAGFRPSHATAGLAFLLWFTRRGADWKTLLRFTFLSSAVFFVVYSPVLVTYGFPHKPPFSHLPLVNRILMTGYHGLAIFGALQTILLILVLLWARWKRLTRLDFRGGVETFLLVFAGMQLLLFLVTGYEEGYLIPFAAMIVLLLDRAVKSRWLRIVLVVMIASYNFVQLEMMGGTSGHRTIAPHFTQGYTLAHQQLREEELHLRALAENAQLKRPALLMYGITFLCYLNDAHYVDLEPTKLYRQRGGNLYISDFIAGEDSLKAWRQRGVLPLISSTYQSYYVMNADYDWHSLVYVVDDLDEFFRNPDSLIQVGWSATFSEQDRKFGDN